jgi:hypothetical protein
MKVNQEENVRRRSEESSRGREEPVQMGTQRSAIAGSSKVVVVISWANPNRQVVVVSFQISILDYHARDAQSRVG